MNKSRFQFLHFMLVIKSILGFLTLLYVIFIYFLFYGAWFNSQFIWERLLCVALIWSGLFYAVSTFWLWHHRRWAWGATVILEALFLIVSGFIFLQSTWSYLHIESYVKNVLLSRHTILLIIFFFFLSFNIVYFCKRKTREIFCIPSSKGKVVWFGVVLMAAVLLTDNTLTQIGINRVFEKFIAKPKPKSVRIISFKSGTFIDVVVTAQFYIDPKEIALITHSMQPANCEKIFQNFYPKPPLKESQCFSEWQNKKGMHTHTTRALGRRVIWNPQSKTVYFQASSDENSEDFK